MAYNVSRIRKPYDDLSRVRSVYDANADMFSLKIHHRGVFFGFLERRVYSWKTNVLPFKVLNNDLDYRLKALACDEDVISFSKHVGNKKVVKDGENSNDSDDSQDVEFPGCSSHSAISNEVNDVDKYVEVIDNDSFDNSESDKGDDIRKRKLKELNKNNTYDDNLNEIPFFYGQHFGSSNEVKLLVKKHSLETRRELKLVNNDKERVRAICFGTIPVFSDGPNDGGPSNIVYSSIVPINIGCSSIEPVNTVAKPSGKKQKKKIKEDETWVVKTFNDVHKCLQQINGKAATAGFLSKKIIDQVKVSPEIPVKAIQDQLQKKYHLDVLNMKAFRAKSKAYAHVKGDYREQYKVLRSYCLELSNKNPCTTVRIEVEPEKDLNVETRVFNRIYICLGPLKAEFGARIRDLLGLDEAFIKGPSLGKYSLL
nr:hypothetical protein [Tanacetum cinerariifolium]